MKYLPFFVVTVGVALGLIGFGQAASATTLYPTSGNYRLKDSAMIEHDGVWHVFSIHDCMVQHPGCDSTPSGFRHYASTDMSSWADLGFVIAPRGTGWESDNVWAPSIVEHNGVFTMFYTGVDNQNGSLVQSIGYATSTDLYTWNRPANNQILNCDDLPWVYWNPSEPYAVECRDPYVTWDTDSNQWIMAFVSRVEQTSGQWPWVANPMVVGLATSPDLLTWSDAGMIPATRWYVAESPHLFTHNGQAYLGWTDNCGRGSCLQYGTATTMLGSWTRVGNWPGMPATDFASEVLAHQGHDYTIVVHGRGLTLGEIAWNGTVPQAGTIQAVQVSGRVWLENTVDDQFGTGESAVSGIFPVAYRDDGDAIFTPGTDTVYTRNVSGETGTYQLNPLLPGTYWLAIDYALLAPASRAGLAPTTSVVGPLVVTGAMSVNIDWPLHPIGHQWVSNTLDATFSGDLAMENGVISGTDGVIEPITGESIAFQQLNQLNVGVAGSSQAWRLQLSNDGGGQWLWWNGDWVSSNQSFAEGNDLPTINNHLASLPTGTGQFLWRMVVETTDQVTLLYVGVQHDDRSTAPLATSPIANQTVNTLRPTFEATLADPNGNSLVAEIQVDTVPTFTSPARQLISSLTNCYGWVQNCSSLTGAVSYLAQTNVPNGQLYWRIRTIDLQGAAVWSEWSVVESFVAPDAVSLSTPTVTILSTSSIRVDWTSNNPGTSFAWFNGDDNGDTYESEPVQNHSLVLTGLTPGVTYDVGVGTYDIYGQSGNQTASPVTMPLAPTLISNIIVTPGINSITISWMTNVASNGLIEYGLTSAYGQSAGHSDLRTNHSLTINNLTGGQVYHFRLNSGPVLPAVSNDLMAFVQPQYYEPVQPPANDMPVLRRPGRR